MALRLVVGCMVSGSVFEIPTAGSRITGADTIAERKDAHAHGEER